MSYGGGRVRGEGRVARARRANFHRVERDPGSGRARREELAREIGDLSASSSPHNCGGDASRQPGEAALKQHGGRGGRPATRPLFARRFARPLADCSATATNNGVAGSESRSRRVAESARARTAGLLGLGASFPAEEAQTDAVRMRAPAVSILVQRVGICDRYTPTTTNPTPPHPPPRFSSPYQPARAHPPPPLIFFFFFFFRPAQRSCIA